MRLLSYNAFNGGEDDSARPVRLDPIIEVILAQSPDLVVMQEAVRFDVDQRLSYVAERLGMSSTLARANSHGDHPGFHVAAFFPRHTRLAEPPIAHTEGFWHAALELTFELTDGNPLTVVAFHLDPFSRAHRISEARRLADLFGDRMGNVLLVGDLNTLPSQHALDTVSESRRRRYCFDDGTVDSRPLAVLQDAGLIDLFPAVTRSPGESGATVPTPLAADERDECGPVYRHIGPAGNFRLDGAFANTALAETVERMTVVRNEQAARSSDHYPLLVDSSAELATTPSGPPHPRFLAARSATPAVGARTAARGVRARQAAAHRARHRPAAKAGQRSVAGPA